MTLRGAKSPSRDLLHVDGADFAARPLVERKAHPAESMRRQTQDEQLPTPPSRRPAAARNRLRDGNRDP
jgi:hypothetical protein